MIKKIYYVSYTMEALNEVNDLITTKMCSPVIIFSILVIMSLVCIYSVRSKLMRYNTVKMDNLQTMHTYQELKYILTLGIVMFGLCQYNKTELAWIFLVFPIIYVIIQNVLLYIHIASAVQNAPEESPQQQSFGMSSPLLESKGPASPQITSPPPATTPPPAVPTVSEYSLPKITTQQNMSQPLTGGFGSISSDGGSPW